MKVSGFTIIRNAILYDYPIVEAIKSILPVCDELIVNVGKSEDDTLSLVQSINSPKIKIIESIWNDDLREGGRVLAEETSKAMAAVDKDCTWCFYIQGDEVIHEKYLPAIKSAMRKYKNDKTVEGLLFNYTHFYGSYHYVGDTRRWYKNEIRVVKNDKAISPYRDAQGFRKNNEKLKVKKIKATIHHYGWVKPPKQQQEKQKTFHKFWHPDDWIKKNVSASEEYDYSGIDSLSAFTGTHPAVMSERVKNMNWKFAFHPRNKKIILKNKILMFIEKKIGWRPFEYKNYKII